MKETKQGLIKKINQENDKKIVIKRKRIEIG